jgi:hypothetical protein
VPSGPDAEGPLDRDGHALHHAIFARLQEELLSPMRELIAPLLALTAGCTLVYSGWQSTPGGEELLTLGIMLALSGLVTLLWRILD